MCFSSKLISLPKFLPTTHCHVGKKVSSKIFLSSFARSWSWNLLERCAFYCTNSIAFSLMSTTVIRRCKGMLVSQLIGKLMMLTFVDV